MGSSSRLLGYGFIQAVHHVVVVKVRRTGGFFTHIRSTPRQGENIIVSVTSGLKLEVPSITIGQIGLHLATVAWSVGPLTCALWRISVV